MGKTYNTALPLLAACVVILTATACGSSKAGSAALSTGPSAQKKEISISLFDRGQVPAEEGSYENNRWTGWINENSPVQVKWVPIPRNEAQTKLNTMLASGSAPDLIWEYERNYIAQLANQGAIQPIDEYIEKYSITFKQYLQEHPELKSYLTIDGRMYAVSSARGPESIANHGMWIRQDWLDKLGLKTPETVEELVETARRFKEDDPDGNGKNDTVPIVFNGNGNIILRTLFLTGENQWYLEGEKLQFGRINDRYTDSLALQKLLYDEGLIDQEYITDKSFQRSTQLWTTGHAGIFLGSWSMESLFMDLKRNVPHGQMVPLEPVSSPYGKSGLYQETPVNILIAFNSTMNEDKIQAAVEFLDWMLAEGWKPLKYGEENVHYRLINGVYQTTDNTKYQKEVQYAREYSIVNQYAVQPEWIPIMAASDALSQEYAQLKSRSLEIAMKNQYRRDIAYNPSHPELTQLLATYTPIAQQIEARVITGGDRMTPEGGMEELRKEWKRLGGENAEKLVNQWYQSNKEQLN